MDNNTSNTGGMSPEEYEVMTLLMQAHDKFAQLERTHPNEIKDWVDAIHTQQAILGMRVLRRDYPDYWATHKKKE